MVFKSFIEIDGKKILHELFEKYKNEDWVLSSDEIERKQYSIFPGKWGNKVLMKYKIKFGLISGLLWLTPPTSIDIDVLLGWVHSRKKLIFIHLNSIHDVNKELKITSSTNIILRDLKYVSDLNVKSEEIKITMSEPEVQFLQKFIDKFTLEVDNKFESERIKEKIERKNRIEKEKKTS